jgi:CspA family cold shock protein
MQRGTIKTITDKGFGFISQEGSKKDLFFHAREMNGVSFDEMRVGDDVEFNVEDGPKGPFATDVQRAARD